MQLTNEHKDTIRGSLVNLRNAEIVRHLGQALNYEYPLDYEPFAAAYAFSHDAPQWIKDKYSKELVDVGTDCLMNPEDGGS